MTTIEKLSQLMVKLAESQAQTDEQMKKSQRERDEQIKKSQREWDKRMKETEKQMKETSKKIDKLSDYVGSIGKNQGFVAEEFFINSISDTLELGGIQYDELNKNMAKKTKKAEGEFDIVLVNGKELALIEVKYKAHEKDIDDLVNKKHKNFKVLYPEYNDYVHHLGLASFYIYDDIKTKAKENNVMILQRKGDLLVTTLPSEI
jgi:hypothetical protein